MKVAVVSFGHADSAVPMTKALSDKLDEIDLFFSFSLNKKRNNIIDFEDIKVTTGLQDEKIVANIVSQEVKDFINKKFGLYFFIYQDLKLKTIKNWLLSFKFFKILKKYDVIHFNGTNGVLPQLILFLYFKKMVFSIHDYECHFGEKNENKLFDFNTHFTKYIIKSRNQIILQNRHDYHRVKKEFPDKADKLNFIPFGYLEIYKNYLVKEIITDNKKCDILFFGRISPYKGIEYLIEAIDIVKKTIPSVTAIIAGSGNFYFDISKAENDPAISILNRFIPSKELVQLIHSTKIIVCPYIEATQSGVLMTAFAFNKPIIASDVGGFQDIIHDDINGKLVRPKDPFSLANAIKELLEYPEKMEEMSKNIKKNGESGLFSWNNISSNIIKVYEK